MSKNTGSGYRKGAIKNRTQCYNKTTKTFMKRDKKTGRFISGKSSAYKGVSQEKKSTNKANLNF
jgi:hypothetical protein